VNDDVVSARLRLAVRALASIFFAVVCAGFGNEARLVMVFIGNRDLRAASAAVSLLSPELGWVYGMAEVSLRKIDGTWE